MRHVITIAKNNVKRGTSTGCGECQASCQSACKTSCTVANQSCQNRDERIHKPSAKVN